MELVTVMRLNTSCLLNVWTPRSFIMSFTVLDFFLMCTCQSGMGIFVLQTAVISDEKAEEFKHKVYRAIFLTQVAEYFLIALGSLCIVVAIVLVVTSVPYKKYLELSIQVSRNRYCLILFLS